MVTISTPDKFLGSLMGAYIGHHYLEKYQGKWLSVSKSPLYNVWLSSIEPQNIPSLLATSSMPTAIPWLLYHHDDCTGRIHWLNQALAYSTTNGDHHASLYSNRIKVLYILGDCLEWLMQCPKDAQEPHLDLCHHLRQQQSTSPSAIIPQLNQLIQTLASPSLDSYLQTLDHTEPSFMALTSALKRCMYYRENLALALSRSDLTAPTPTLIGCLLGAWRGPSVLPIDWVMAIPQDSKEALRHMAQQLYCSWAGLKSKISGTYEIFPLDF